MIDFVAPRILFGHKDKSGVKNVVTDYMRRIDKDENYFLIQYNFPYEHLLPLCEVTLWFAYFVSYLVARVLPANAYRAQIYKIKSDAKYFSWDDSYMWKFYSDQVIRGCVSYHEIHPISNFYHASQVGGHFGP